MVSWWVIDSYSNNEKSKQGMLYLWILYIFHQDQLDQEFVQNILDITHIQVEEVILDKNQHQYMDHSMNIIFIFHAW